MKPAPLRLCTLILALVTAFVFSCNEPDLFDLGAHGHKGPPTGHTHNWGEWHVMLAVTCIAKGEETRTCSRNSTHTETRETPIDPDAHHWEPVGNSIVPTCTTDGHGTIKCEHCGDEMTSDHIPALGHDWGAWITTTFPTDITTGVETRTCTRNNNHTETRSISIPPINMVWIPAGTFTMGSPTTELGRYYGSETEHQVTLTKGFYMGRYQVTQEQYAAVMGSNPNNTYGVGNKYPVYCVSWYDAIVFCNRLSINDGLSPAYYMPFCDSTDPAQWGTVPTSNNTTWDAVQVVEGSTGYRLPTEAQWENACRAGTTTAFNWGTNYINSGQANYDAEIVNENNTVVGTYLGRTTEVGSYAPNTWGLYDMHGNVWEWCWDWYETYLSGVQTDPVGASSGSNRVLRGGSWYNSAANVRSACRSGSTPSSRDYDGFRLVRPAQ